MQLIKVEPKQIGSRNVNAVDARELHGFLGVGRDFSSWIKQRIEKYNFKENRDFVILLPGFGEQHGGQNRIEYALSLNMAKELCMVENNEMGKQAREYFIEMEEKAQSQSIPEPKPMQLPEWAIEGQGVASVLSRYNTPRHMIASEEFKHIVKIGGPDLTHMVGQLPCSQNIQIEEEMLEATELAKRFGIASAQRMNKIIQSAGLQIRGDGEWVPTEKGKPLCSRHAWQKQGKSGYNWKWKVSAIASILDEEEE